MLLGKQFIFTITALCFSQPCFSSHATPFHLMFCLSWFFSISVCVPGCQTLCVWARVCVSVCTCVCDELSQNHRVELSGNRRTLTLKAIRICIFLVSILH